MTEHHEILEQTITGIRLLFRNHNFRRFLKSGERKDERCIQYSRQGKRLCSRGGYRLCSSGEGYC